MKVKNEDHPNYGGKKQIKNSEDEVIERALEIMKGRMKVSGQPFTDPMATRSYIALKTAELQHEEFGCLFLDNQNQLIADEVLFTGTIDSASVYPREVVKRVLHHNANAVIFYHNHPSGLCEPSRADHNITDKLRRALELIDVRSLDHIIAASLDTYSFADHQMI